MILSNRSHHDDIIAGNLAVAQTYISRLIGLMGRKPEEFGEGHGLWLRPGNSIHMWFMRFPIDVVFVDHELKVKRVYEGLKPWRVTSLVWGAKSVFELPAGTLKNHPVRIGDQLHVGA